MEQNMKGKAVASLVLGICSIVFAGLIGLVCAIIGLVLGINAKKTMAPDADGFGMAKAGVILGIIGLIFSAIVFVACISCYGCATCAGISSIPYYYY